MKKDLFTVAIAAVAGFAIAYFMTNLLYTGISSFSFKVLDTVVDTSISEPNPEVFNFRAVNPTVEVYVGGCGLYDEDGNCIEQEDEEDEIGETTENENLENEITDDEEFINGGTD